MANPPSTIGPFANVPAPGSPIRSDWAQAITHFLWDARARVIDAAMSAGNVAGTIQIGSDGCLESGFIETAGSPNATYYASSPDVTVFQGGAFYNDEFLPAYNTQFGTEPTSVFHAHAYDAAQILFAAITAVAADDGSGNLTISRTALRDAVFATNGYEGITGIITCNEFGDCATDVTIGIFEYPNWPVEGGADPTDPVYSDTKTLADVI